MLGFTGEDSDEECLPTCCYDYFFLPTSGKVLPTFGKYWPVRESDRDQIAKTLVHFIHFQIVTALRAAIRIHMVKLLYTSTFYRGLKIATHCCVTVCLCFIQDQPDTTGQPGGWGLKNPHRDCGPLFSSIFDNSRENNGQAPFVTLVRGSTIAIITPMCQASTCGRHLAPGQTWSAPKQWKLDVHVKG